MVSVIQCTKVLLAARKHRLYTHLGEGSSAPLVRQEPVTDESLAALIQANMTCFDAVEKFHPFGIETWVSIYANKFPPMWSLCPQSYTDTHGSMLDKRPSRGSEEYPS